MNPYLLLGRPYRLGGDFIKYKGGDCLSLARTVLAHYGISTPEPQRDWYRRLRRGDTSVFKEELERWGQQTTNVECGVVALCESKNGYGMAVYFENGWMNYGESEVRWSPAERLHILAFYSPRKSS